MKKPHKPKQSAANESKTPLRTRSRHPSQSWEMSAAEALKVNYLTQVTHVA